MQHLHRIRRLLHLVPPDRAAGRAAPGGRRGAQSDDPVPA